MYERVWNDFQNICFFRYIVEQRINVTNIYVNIVIVFMHDKGYSASTIASYNSAIIGYYHKLGGFPDRTASFYITKLLQGAKRKCPSVDVRFPITLSILHKLVDALDHSCNSEYNRSTLYVSMYVLLVFYAFYALGNLLLQLPMPLITV